jgi:outer membrane protein OmpA-like peptidoglycan-associated protein
MKGILCATVALAGCAHRVQPPVCGTPAVETAAYFNLVEACDHGEASACRTLAARSRDFHPPVPHDPQKADEYEARARALETSPGTRRPEPLQVEAIPSAEPPKAVAPPNEFVCLAFPGRSSAITAEARGILGEVLRTLERHPELRALHVVGPAPDAADSLSLRRAEAVVRLLVGLGVAPARLRARLLTDDERHDPRVLAYTHRCTYLRVE